MKLHQIKIEFVPEHDRLLLAISTAQGAEGEGQEMLLWLTRRCVKLLWPGLLKLAAAAPDIALQSHPQARQALLGMRHEAALGQADFSQPYEAAPRARPLGAEPLLVARMQSQVLGSGQFLLDLLPREGEGVSLTLDETLLHSFSRLLAGAVARADWDMQLGLPVAEAGEGDMPSSIN